MLVCTHFLLLVFPLDSLPGKSEEALSRSFNCADGGIGAQSVTATVGVLVAHAQLLALAQGGSRSLHSRTYAQASWTDSLLPSWQGPPCPAKEVL